MTKKEILTSLLDIQYHLAGLTDVPVYCSYGDTAEGYDRTIVIELNCPKGDAGRVIRAITKLMGV